MKYYGENESGKSRSNVITFHLIREEDGRLERLQMIRKIKKKTLSTLCIELFRMPITAKV